MSPYDVRNLSWRVKHAGEGYVLEGVAEIMGCPRVELYFPNEDAFKEWASFTLLNALSVRHRQDQAAQDVKRAIERGVEQADKYATAPPTAAEIAEKVVESLAKAGLSVEKAKVSVPPKKPVSVPQAATSAPVNVQNEENQPRNWSEDDLAEGIWMDPTRRLWQLHIKGDGPPLEDKTGVLWHWAGGYTYDDQGAWPQLSRNDGTVKDLSWSTVWNAVGPLFYTDKIEEG
jgi:hypothetical protein